MSGIVNNDELMILAFAVCDERATNAQIEQIEDILDGNRAAKLLYLKCLNLHSQLEHRGRRFGLHRPIVEKIRECLPDELSAGKRGQAHYVRSTLRALPANGACSLFSPVPALGSPSLLLSLVNPAPWAAYAMAGLFLAVGVLAAWAWSLSGGHPDSQLAGGMQMGVQIAATAAPAAGKPATAPIRPKGPTDLRLPTRAAQLGPVRCFPAARADRRADHGDNRRRGEGCLR